MKESKEVSFCKKVFSSAGRTKSIVILDNSNLTDREKELMICRFLKGLSLKECSELFLLEEDSVNKAQKKTCIKLYNFLTQS